jgi:hypothetical protein
MAEISIVRIMGEFKTWNEDGYGGAKRKTGALQ